MIKQTLERLRPRPPRTPEWSKELMDRNDATPPPAKSRETTESDPTKACDPEE